MSTHNVTTPTSTRSGGTLSSPRRGPSEYDNVRLLAQKDDLWRRIAERDERNNKLRRSLSLAEARERELSSSLVAEKAERRLAEEESARAIQKLQSESEKQQSTITDMQGQIDSKQQTIVQLAHAKREALEHLAAAKAQIESLRTEVVRAESVADELHAERVRRDALDVKFQKERLALQQALAAANAKLAARAPLYVDEGPSRRRVVAPTLVDGRTSRRIIVPIL